MSDHSADEDLYFPLPQVRAPIRRAVAHARWRARRLRPSALAESTAVRLRRRPERDLLVGTRGERDVCWLEDDDDDEPLVSVRIATIGRDELFERSLPAARSQSYDRLEILVVAEGCDLRLGSRLRSLLDPRIRLVELPHVGVYPARDRARWQVAGSRPMNVGISTARGAWIAPCDDDDAFTEDHVEVLLGSAKSQRVELIHSQTQVAVGRRRWGVLGSPTLREGQVTHGSVMYSLGLRFMTYSATCWRMDEAFDWNLWRRMADLEVRIGYLPKITYSYFPSAATLARYQALVSAVEEAG